MAGLKYQIQLFLHLKGDSTSEGAPAAAATLRSKMHAGCVTQLVSSRTM